MPTVAGDVEPAGASSHPWDVPTELVGASTVAQTLDLHVRYGEQVVRAGLVGPGYATGNGRLVTRQAVEALARRPARGAADLPPALVLRAGPPRWTGDHWAGIHSAMPDAAVAECALRWWAVATPSRLTGHLVVVAVAGFAVWVGRVQGHVRAAGRVGLVAARADHRDADAEQYYTSRLKLPRGAVTVRVGL
ncbi:hypothetical protein [Luteimicrobium xylanilyticum]